MSAYSTPAGTTAANPGIKPPVPPPPMMNARAFSNAYGMHKTAIRNVATHGTTPVNQMSNGFGGRQGGNPNLHMTAPMSGGNRTTQHVATPGNNNVSYASPSLLNSAQTLWQKSKNTPGSPGPVNGMSLGFIKNTAERPRNIVPPPPPPIAVAPVADPVAPVVPAQNPLPGPAPVDHNGGTGVVGGSTTWNGTTYVGGFTPQEDMADGQQTIAAPPPVPAPTPMPTIADIQNSIASGGSSDQAFGPTVPSSELAGTNWTLAQAHAAWDRNHMGAKTHTVNGKLVRTKKWADFLRNHGVID